MAKLIYLSPSDQTDNKYAYGNTTEAAQCRKIADACEVALKRNGFSVINNQKSNMYGRVKESNEKKADLHVCIHTNAFNGTVSGTRMFAWDLKGAGYKAANAVFYYLAPLTPGKSENIKAADYYEIKYTDAPCVYCECEFHDVASVAKWIIEHTTDIGEAIAKGICKYYGVTFNEGKTESQNSLVKTYKVVAGDTLWEIAQNHGTTVDTLARLNNIKDPNKISVGQIIKLPTATTAPTTNDDKEKVLEEDGLWGRDTTKYTQKLFGTPQDSIVSNQLNSCKKYLPNMLATSWEFENTAKGGSVMVVKLQTLIGANPDGYAGIDTIMKLQVFLQNLGLYTGKIDGIAGKQTVIGWQKYINLKSA